LYPICIQKADKILAMNIPPPIQKLVDDATLGHVSSEGDDREFVIPAMRRRHRTGCGWQTLIYSPRIDPAADEVGRFEIEEESEMQGGDTKLVTDDASEVGAWIEENRP
jgi:hypothetical protein